MKNNIVDFKSEDIKVLVFDVDDTITRDTLGIKVVTFKKLFFHALEKLQEAREIYEFTGIGDRYNIIAHILGVPQEECHFNNLVKEWADKFESMTQDAIREQGIHLDDLQTLKIIRNNFQGPVYLLSATPQFSVESNISYFESKYPDIAGMFAGVIGTPMSEGKAGELKKILDIQDVKPNQILMIGDGGSDFNGANGAGTQFVGVVPEGKVDKWPTEHFPKITNISHLLKLLNI